MTRSILVLNAGSSSIKFALYPAAAASDEDRAAYHGEIEGIGHALHMRVRDARRKSVADRAIEGPATHHQGLSALLEWLSAHSQGVDLAALGHRVVHGGAAYAQPVRITPGVLRAYRRLLRTFTKEAADFCRRRGITYLQLRSDVDLQDVVVRTFRRAGIVV